MSTVTKKDLVLTVSEKLEANAADVHEIAQMLFDEMNRQLGLGNRIELRDFGVFSFKKRAARIGHNPRTLEKVEVKEKIVVSFKMGKKMRERVNQVATEESAAPGSTPQAATPPPAAEAATEQALPEPAPIPPQQSVPAGPSAPDRFGSGPESSNEPESAAGEASAGEPAGPSPLDETS